jgi:hypothetical protein
MRNLINDAKEFGGTAKELVGKAPAGVGKLVKMLTDTELDAISDTRQVKDPNIATISENVLSYPSEITADPLGYVNYMPYEYGATQFGGSKRSAIQSMGMKARSGGITGNPIQLNLHMPPDISESLNAKWEAQEDIALKLAINTGLGITAGVAGGIGSGVAQNKKIKEKAAADAAKKAGTTAKIGKKGSKAGKVLSKAGLAKRGGKMALLGGAGALGASIAGNLQQAQSALERRMGVAVRPFEEQFFKGIEFRTFSFSHKLVAFSESDTVEINKLIKAFRFFASPALSKTNLLYTYPATWKIRFYNPSPDGATVQESQWLPTLQRCVLTKVDVKHFASGTPSYYENFAPIDIEITLDFTEMSYHTRENIVRENQPAY